MELHTLIQTVTSYAGPEAEAVLTTAYQLASVAHEGFFRLNGEPFINHPLAVAGILATWLAPPSVVGVGLLHDVLNSNYSHLPTLDHLQSKLALDVFHLLEATFNLNSFIRHFEGDFDREVDAILADDFGREVNANTLLHEAASFVRERDAFIVKIADRLHNLQTSSYLAREHQKKVAMLTLSVFAPLAERLCMEEVKRQIEEESFKILSPAYYALLEHHYANNTLQEEIQAIWNGLQQQLKLLPPKIQVYWQPFSLYTIYHHKLEESARHGKLLHEGSFKLQLVDVGSFIMLTDEDIDCYLLLGTLHKHYSHVERQLHDFIGNRNANGYQSIHTQVKYSGEHLINIIIRTFTMDLIAEYGGTAGWRGMAEELLPRLPAVTRPAEGEMQVFTLTGEVKYLPVGATPLDFAYAIHTDIGNHCTGAKVNGKAMDLYSSLHPNDQVEIIKDLDAKPNVEWLKHVHTSHASNRIRYWLTQESRNAIKERGRTLLNTELQEQGLLATDAEIDHLLTRLSLQENLEGPEELLVSIGCGHRHVSTLAEQLKSMHSSKSVEPMWHVQVLSPEAASLQPVFAKCCHPVPPDDIVGYRRHNRDLIIHRATCVHTRKLKEPVPVQWETTPPEPDYVIVVEAVNRAGLAADLSNMMTTLGFDMLRFDSYRHPDKGNIAETHIYLGHTTSIQRRLIQQELKAVPYVRNIEAIHISNLSTLPQPNPYGPKPAIGARFYGRDTECQAIAAQLHDSLQNSAILLWGQRRIGKTSLLLRLQEQSLGDFLPVYIDVEGLDYYTTTQFLHYLVSHIGQQLKTKLSGSAHEISIPHLERLKSDPLGHFDRFMERVQQVVQYQSLVIILDEFQNLSHLRQETVSHMALFNHLRSLSQHGHGVHLLLSGGGLLSHLTTEPGLASLLNITYEQKLAGLTHSAASHLIHDGLNRVSDMEEEAVDLLISITAGHPYYLQLLCYSLYEQARMGTTIITRDSASQAIDEWLRMTDESRFLHLWVGHTSTDARRNKVILSAIAELGAENHEVEFDRLYTSVSSIVPEQDLVRLLEDLVSMGVLKHDHLNYAIEVELFALWLQHHWPLKLALKEASLL